MTSEERLKMVEYLQMAMGAVDACNKSMRLLEVHDIPHAIHMLRAMCAREGAFEAPRAEQTQLVSLARSIETLEAAKMLWLFAQLGEHWRLEPPVKATGA
jgi:hypothetical protein